MFYLLLIMVELIGISRMNILVYKEDHNIFYLEWYKEVCKTSIMSVFFCNFLFVLFFSVLTRKIMEDECVSCMFLWISLDLLVSPTRRKDAVDLAFNLEIPLDYNWELKSSGLPEYDVLELCTVDVGFWLNAGLDFRHVTFWPSK